MRFVQRGVRVTVVEVAPHVAAHVQRWSHVRLFSPWKYNVCDATVALLEAAGLYDPTQVRCASGHRVRSQPYTVMLIAGPQ